MFTNTPPSIDPYQQPHPVFSGGKMPWWRAFWYKIWPANGSRLHKGIVIGAALLSLAIIIFVVALILSMLTPRPSSVVEQDDKDQNGSSSLPNDREQEGSSPDAAKPEEKKEADKPQANGGNGTTPGGGGNSSPGGSTGGGSTGGGGGTGGGGSSGTGCPLPSYPNASCTGVPAGTTLTVMNGNMTINTPNTVIENKDIRGCVSVEAPGVIIRKSKVSCSGFTVISSRNNYSGARLLVEDTEIHCNSTQGTAMADYNFTARRVNIHSCENGFDMDTDITLEDSYVHDLISYDPVTDPHIDGIQSPIGSRLLINHNTIYATNSAGSVGNAAININNSAGGPTSSDTTISNNLLAGGGYTLYCPIPSTSNFRITNNRFSTAFHGTVGYYGPATDCDSDEIKSGNVYHETSQSVTSW